MAEAESSRGADEVPDRKKGKKGVFKSIQRFFRKNSKKTKTEDESGRSMSMSAESVFLQDQQKGKTEKSKKPLMQSMDAILQKNPRGGHPLSSTSEQNLATNTDGEEDPGDETSEQFFQSSWSMHQLNLPLTTAESNIDLDAVPTTSHVNINMQRDKLGIRQRGKRQGTTHGQRNRKTSPGGIAQSLQILPQGGEGSSNVNQRSKELRLYDPKASNRHSLGKEAEIETAPIPEVKVTEAPVTEETKVEEPKEKLEKRRSVSPEKRSVSPEERSVSPEERSVSPEERSVSPEKRTVSSEKIDTDTKFGDRVKRRSMVEEKVVVEEKKEEQKEEKEEEKEVEKEVEKEEEKAPREVTEFERMVSRFKKTAEQKQNITAQKAAELERQKVVLRKDSKLKQDEENAHKRSSVHEIDPAKKTATPKRSQSMATHTTPPNIQVFKRNSPKVKDPERSKTLPEQSEFVSDDKKNRSSLKDVEEEKQRNEEKSEKKEEIVVKKQEMKIQKGIVVKKTKVKSESLKKEGKKIEVKTEPAKKTEVKSEPVKKIEVKTEPAKKTEVKLDPAKKIEVNSEPANKTEVKSEPAKKTEVKSETAKKSELRTEPAKKTEVKSEPAKKTQVKSEPAKKSELSTEPAKRIEVRTDPPKTVEMKRSEKEEKIEEKKVEITIKKENPKMETSRYVQTPKSVQTKDSKIKVKTLDTDCSWMTLAKKKTKSWNTDSTEDSSEKEVSLRKSSTAEEKAIKIGKRKSVHDMVKNMEQSTVS